ncbi:MAG TPA: 4-alpha-glucanotransferase, partial [Thermoanaerobaculia bacterium]
CVIVGEDLGTVPPEVPKLMNKHGVRRMYVVQYETKPDDPPIATPPAGSIASINTHDMPTFASFWNAKDVDDRLEQDLLDEKGAASERETREKTRRAVMQFLVDKGYLTSGPTENVQTILEGLLAFLASSDAEMMLINPEDLWRELVPQNVPGLPDKSWRHKFRMTLEEAQADGSIRKVLTNVNDRRNG